MWTKASRHTSKHLLTSWWWCTCWTSAAVLLPSLPCFLQTQDVVIHTSLHASPSTQEEHTAGGTAAAGVSVGSDMETESETGSTMGLHCELSDVGPDKEALAEPWLKLLHPYWSLNLNPSVSEGDCFLIFAIFLLGLVTSPGIKMVILSRRKLFCRFCAKSDWNLLLAHFSCIHRTVTHYCTQVQQERSQNPCRRNLRLLNALLLAATTVCAPHVFVIT